jgi:diacylglycerol kinase (ATP)
MKDQPKDKMAVLLNPSSGGNKGIENKVHLEQKLQKYNIPYDLYITESEEDLKRLAMDLSGKYKALVGVGGDSTSTIILNTLLKVKKSIPLGMIGLGSSNDIMKHFNIDSLDKACRVLKDGKISQIDIGIIKVNNEIVSYFFGQANIGIGVCVNKYVTDFKRKFPVLKKLQTLPGIIGIFKSFVSGRIPLQLEIDYGTVPIKQAFILALFSKIKFWATGKIFAPSADSNDGLLNCILVKRCTFLKFLFIILKSFKGGHVRLDEVIDLKASKFKVKSKTPFQIQIDGEILMNNNSPSEFNEIEIEVKKKAVQIIG